MGRKGIVGAGARKALDGNYEGCNPNACGCGYKTNRVQPGRRVIVRINTKSAWEI
jgi:hypothetical protein